MSIINELNAVSEPGDVLDQLAANVYWKGIDGRYISMNQSMRKDCAAYGVDSDCVGASDLDLFPEEFAHDIFLNDQAVIKQKSVQVFEEAGELNGHAFKYVSTKQPFIQNGVIIGVIGTSILVERHKNQFKQKFPASFSIREKECIYWYSKGYTAKEIAQFISISHRTVEKYLEHARAKLGCSTRAEVRQMLSQ